MFDTLDKDGSGSIDVGELGSALKELGLPQPEEKVRAALVEADLDGNGSLDFGEFSSIVTAMKSGRRGSHDINFAKVYDKQAQLMKIEGASGITHRCVHEGHSVYKC